MSFQPVLPIGGYAGWRFLERTLERQQESHAASPTLRRAETEFRARIAGIHSAQALVEDRNLLKVALTAFGLRDDLPNRAFIQRVLESPASESRSFANRLADRRYAALAEAFGFGEAGPPKTAEPGFADRIVALYHDRSFEEAVGAQDESMRLALALQRDLGAIAQRDTSEDARWLTVLGTPSLRTVFESAYRLPNGFGALDLDRQVDILRGRTRAAMGDSSLAQFADPERIDKLIQRFMLAEQVNAVNTMGSGQVALTLLQGIQPIGLLR